MSLPIPKQHSEQNVEAIEVYRIALYEKYIERLVFHLNAVHKEVHDRRYWEIIIGPWLLFFIYYTHYVYSQNEPRTNLATTEDTYQLAYDHLTFLYLFDMPNHYRQVARLMQAEGEAPPIQSWQCKKYEQVRWGTLRRLVLRCAGFLTRGLSVFGRCAMVSPYMSWRAQLQLCLLSRLQIVPVCLYDNAKPKMQISPALRSWQGLPHGGTVSDGFEGILEKIVLQAIPYVYLEGYKDLKRRLGQVPRGIKVIFSAAGWQQNEMFKFYAAQAQERGARLIGYQHGGLYGMGKAKTIEFEEWVTDRFLTWGWTGGERVRPFLSVKLAETQRVYEKCKKKSLPAKDILYVTTTGSQYWPDVMGCPSGKQFNEYLDWQGKFLKALQPSCLADVVVRVYPGDRFYCWNQQERLEQLSLEVMFNNSDPYVSALSRAKLVVCDNNFTTFLEAYACDIPTVIFFDRNLWPLNNRFHDLWGEMERVGLLHGHYDSAASHVSAISEAPHVWWRSSEVRSVQQKVAESFARVESQPLHQLANLLMQEVRG